MGSQERCTVLLKQETMCEDSMISRTPIRDLLLEPDLLVVFGPRAGLPISGLQELGLDNSQIAALPSA